MQGQYIQTTEGGMQYAFAMSHHLEFFSKAGSLYLDKRRQMFYQETETALSLFQKMWAAGDKQLAMQLLFWLRDPRGGAGNRSGARSIFHWLAQYDTPWMLGNLHLVPEYGRWDDLRSFYGTPLQLEAAQLWADAILAGNVLAAKWADRKKDSHVKHALGMKVADFRRLLASIRSQHIVEHKMSTGRWGEIKYENVPSVAFKRYVSAFERHDSERFAAFMEAVKSGEAKVHTGTLFPHDLFTSFRMRKLDAAHAATLFEQLPDYYDTGEERVFPIVDTSGSMFSRLYGNTWAIDVSLGLGMYCSDRNKGVFHRKMMIFSDEGEFLDWSNVSVAHAMHNLLRYGPAGSTQIYKALMTLLNAARTFGVPHDHFPTVLLIISDMQFSVGAYVEATEVEAAMRQYERAGYPVPKVVYWNLAGYAGSPAQAGQVGVALISGFSPAVMQHVFKAGFDPVKIMQSAASKYEVICP